MDSGNHIIEVWDEYLVANVLLRITHIKARISLFIEVLAEITTSNEEARKIRKITS